MIAPWLKPPLDKWDIVVMVHYHDFSGRRMIFVTMALDEKCIREEGPDDEYIWNRLWHKAYKYERRSP